MKYFTIILLLAVASSCGSPEPEKSKPDEPNEGSDMKITVYHWKDISIAQSVNTNETIVNTRFAVNAIMEGAKTKSDFENGIKQTISQITESSPEIDELYVYVFSDSTMTEQGFDLAEGSWKPQGAMTDEIAKKNIRDNYEIKTNVRDDIQKYLDQINKENVRHGLSKDERKEIFKALYNAEKQAKEEAEEKYPVDINNLKYAKSNIEKNVNENSILLQEKQEGVRIKFGIDEDIQWSIIEEAINENWVRK